jgi:choline-sulfatase
MGQCGLAPKSHGHPENRFALNAAMQAGASASEHWDYNPPSDAAHQYGRNHMDWTVVADRFRFPPVR